MQHADETIVVYNRKYDAARGYDVYCAAVIPNVSWHGTALAAPGAEGLAEANQYTIRIPDNADYLTPADYAASASVNNRFTLAEGDLIALGTAAVENPTPAAIHKGHDTVATIIGVTDNRKGRSPHWKVTAK